MERCVRCKKELGLGSTIPIEMKGDKILLVHFFCATPGEVGLLYGEGAHVVDVPIVEEKESK